MLPTQSASEPVAPRQRFSLRLEPTPNAPPMVRLEVDWSTSASLLLLCQLAVQYVFLIALDLADRAQPPLHVVVCYLTVLVLQAGYALYRPGRTRILTSIAMTNTICLFYAAEVPYLMLLVTLAWLSRTFLVRSGRHIFNPGTFGVFWGGLLTMVVGASGAATHPISHNFNHIPHFTIVVVLLGTGMALMGRHLDIVIPAILGFFIGRGFPNASELIIFFFAATDPVTVPKRTVDRVIFGFVAALLTAIFWHLTKNELYKVGGLLLTGAFMPLVVRLNLEQRLSALVGAVAEGGWWSRPRLRWFGAAVLAAYAFAADTSVPSRTSELIVRLVEANTGRNLDHRAYSGLFAKDVELSYRNTRIRTFWSDLYGGWSWFGASAHPEPIDAKTPIQVSYWLTCHPELESHGSVVTAQAIPPDAPGPQSQAKPYSQATIVLQVDIGAVKQECHVP